MSGIRLYKGYSKKNFRVGVVKPKPLEEDKPIVFIAPEWISGGNLGTFTSGDEVYIQLEYTDTDAIISEFFMFDSLPPNLVLNKFDGSISGYVEVEDSAEYTFSIFIRTIQNKVYEQQFSMNVVAYSTEIVWVTEPDLGEYNAGDAVNESISATLVTVQQ